MLKIGSHVSMSGKEMYEGAVNETLNFEANSLMIYTGAPQNTRRKPLEELKIDNALNLMHENNIDLNNVVVHAPYIMNLANPDQEKRDFAVEFLTKEVERTNAMKVNKIVLHPGSAVGLDRIQAVKWIAEGLNQVIANTPDANVTIALETMAGKGNEVGRTFNELADIISQVDKKERITVCFDTCHVHDSGYDIVNNLDGVLKEFDEIVGLNKISVIHVNDSKNEMGARKDRHENIGFGYIGFDALISIIYNDAFKDIPKILETPFVEKVPPYYHEIKMIREKVFNPNLKEDILK